MNTNINAFMTSKEKLSFKLAALLLLKKKEVSFSEIESLPTVTDKEDVEEVMEYLMSHFNVEKISEKTSSYPMLSWETVLKLQSPK